MKSFRPLWVAVVLGVCLPFALLRGATAEATYRGFTIDYSHVRGLPELDAMSAATKEQIDMVCAVGVPAEMLDFFRSVTFLLVPAGTIPSGSPGFYGGRDRSVKVVSSIVKTGHKPVLLHELLHAYHDQKLPRGFDNRDVAALFAQARKAGPFAAKSHMMQNDREFFACAGTAYLFGVTAQEPFSREKVRQGQPELLAFLAKVFGPDAGSYAGSLSR